MSNKIIIRKNATKKIAAILNTSKYMELRKHVPQVDDSTIIVVSMIDRGIFDLWFKKNYGDMKIEVSVDEDGVERAVFKGEYWFSDRVTVAFKTGRLNDAAKNNVFNIR